MDTTQRLAAYLSGDLDADERTALEAELAGDPALRDRLERIRESDEALASLGDVALPDGFEQRLDATVDGVLDEVLGDELSARRARRRAMPGWVPALAAAAVAVVVGGGVVLSGLGGSDEAAMTTTDAAGDDAAGDGEGIQSFANGGDAAAESAPAVPGPRIVADDREITPAALQDLAANPELVDLIAGVPVDDQPVTVARAWAAALGADVNALGALDERTDAAEEQATESANRDADDQVAALGAVSDPVVRFDGNPTEEDRRDVGRCVSQLYEDAAAPVVPLYAELATDEDGDDVIVYAALARDADGAYQRIEVWMLQRDDCSLRQFVQHDR